MPLRCAASATRVADHVQDGRLRPHLGRRKHGPHALCAIRGRPERCGRSAPQLGRPQPRPVRWDNAAAYLGVTAIVDRSTAIGQRSGRHAHRTGEQRRRELAPEHDAQRAVVSRSWRTSGTFRAFATYDAAATTTGSRWTIYCATAPLNYRSERADRDLRIVQRG